MKINKDIPKYPNPNFTIGGTKAQPTSSPTQGNGLTTATKEDQKAAQSAAAKARKDTVLKNRAARTAEAAKRLGLPPTASPQEISPATQAAVQARYAAKRAKNAERVGLDPTASPQ